MTQDQELPNAGELPRRLFVYTAGFLRQPTLRRILRAHGVRVVTGIPKPPEAIGVWGQSPYATRGEAMARKTGAAVYRLEDAFLRSVQPGRAGAAPLGLIMDRTGVHFDPRTPSDLETLLATAPLDDTPTLSLARDAIAFLKSRHLSKYTAYPAPGAVPDPGYVLIVDQTRDDASVRASGGTEASFQDMLVQARLNHPGARIVIKTHPETQAGLRAGYFNEADISDDVTLWDQPASPWALLEGAIAVYTLSSQMGFEAILAGHKPHVFGGPFYSGWGLSHDYMDLPRRGRRLTPAQLFAAAMIHYPLWYDPYNDAPATLEDVLYTLDAQTRAWREDHQGWVAGGMRLWKRHAINGFFGGTRPVRFRDPPSSVDGRRVMAWASQAAPDIDVVRVEDGFLRSRGLGAVKIFKDGKVE